MNVEKIIEGFKTAVQNAKDMEKDGKITAGLCSIYSEVVDSYESVTYEAFTDILKNNAINNSRYYPFNCSGLCYIRERKSFKLYQNKRRLKAIDDFIDTLEKLK